ncbi:DUF6112 family protein [Actinomyces israelii]|uniref:DUF6112 family protein n=1 Tax=Actinomyces israelii TaxID=1659 RepID=UPI0005B97387|nr:DUF6112 family protein [Actinomyces israelii]
MIVKIEAVKNRALAAAALLVPADGSGYDPGVRPDWTYLPFMGTLGALVNSTVAIVLTCLVAVMAISGLVWAAGYFWDHGRASHAGKAGVVISIIAAFVVGGASAFVKWAAGLGASSV